MPDINVVSAVDRAIIDRLHPAVTRWNRLEGRPRTHHFDRALRAEVRDAMWMLSRQWQLGEFEGDDAGSPVLVRACVDLRTIDRYQAAGGAVHDVGANEAIEARVEARPVPLRAGAQYLSLDLRMAAGRRWQRLLDTAQPPLSRDYSDDYRTRYGVEVPDPAAESDAAVCAHFDAWQQVGCAAERSIDGLALLEYLAEAPAHRAADGIAAAGDEAALDQLADRLRAWFEQLVDQPETDDDAWLPARLEYGFGLSAPSGETGGDGEATEVVMRADEYHHGNLDWWALERRDDPRLGDPAAPAPVAPVREVQTVIPTQVVFDGMPNTRWWSFEDRRTNFGQVDPDTTDLGKLMLMEFALVFSNDWFVVPWTLPVGCVAEFQGAAVSTVFDERLWVTPIRDRPAGADWERWTMFTLTDDEPGGTADRAPTTPPQLVLLPTAPKVQEGDALEEIALVRDEMANMVWAIEHQIPLPTGWRRAGPEAAHEYRTHLRRIAGVGPVGPPPPAAPLRYRVMNEVPEQWIPFIAVHVDGSARETQLQRSALPRFLEGHPNPRKIRPRTPLLRHNLPRSYLIHEEEVSRAGTVISQCYQRTRLPDGTVVTWYGARRSTGRGEGSSGLAFDQLVDAPPPPPR
jgi:hypothetical protein